MLKNKVILILSPQDWGTMYLSKHHYAIELARAGNTVFFLNPPSQKDASSQAIHIERSEVTERLFFISHTLPFSYNLKFHLKAVFHFLMRFHMHRILKQVGRKVDIVWSFDLGNLYPFRIFPKSALKLFHPVDEPISKAALESMKGSEVIFSVTQEILEKYKVGVPKYFINHGVASYFFDSHNITSATTLKIGLSGNLLRSDIDRPILLSIIRENPGIVFEFWGSYRKKDSNIGGDNDPGTSVFIKELAECPNVILRGPLSPEYLPWKFAEVAAFLICYDVQKDQSGGTNYHKVMEYLSSGKVIISNNITTYSNRPELVAMVEERDNNNHLPQLFKQVINNLDRYNHENTMRVRRQFASEHTYTKQLEKIDEMLSVHFPGRIVQ